MRDPKDPDGPTPAAPGAKVLTYAGPPLRARPPAPFTAAELRAALDWALPRHPRLADAIYADAAPNLDPTDTTWNSDVSLLVALLSPAHAERVRAYLGWPAERMASELARVRAEYPR